MYLKLSIPTAQAIADALAETTSSFYYRIKRGLSYQEPFLAELDYTDNELVATLTDIAEALGDRSLKMQLNALKNVLDGKGEEKVSELRLLPLAIAQYLKTNYQRGWLFEQVGKAWEPYLVTNVNYIEGKDKERACVRVAMVRNDKTQQRTREIYFDSDDIRRGVGDILSKANFFHETPELIAQYEEDEATYLSFKAQHYEQFVASGTLFDVSSRYTYEELEAVNARFVNDEPGRQKYTLRHEADNHFWTSNHACAADQFTQVPQAHYLYGFSLTHHRSFFVHCSALTPYVYRPELREKLILRETHRDIIELLVEGIGELKEDLIVGKSGGTVILSHGPPGVGKTLSGEIYAEVIRRPLYQVQAGQLGIDAETVEVRLKEILARASRFRAVLLVNEADVFVRSRGNDLVQNAIVAAFLQALEYHDGLVFLTTNRQGDVDDAILSRCRAIVKYELPNKLERQAIFRVLAKQYELELGEELIAELAEKFDGISGRDIKGLIALAEQYHRKRQVPVDYDLFRKLAVFRGL